MAIFTGDSQTLTRQESLQISREYSLDPETTKLDGGDLASPLYACLTRELIFENEDQRHWWSIIAPTIQVLLVKFQHNRTQQHQYLMLIYRYVVPVLGPRPSPVTGPQYKSFMTDDFSPFEPGINFHSGRATVRLGLEPVGSLAGTEEDPFNQSTVQKFMRSMEEFADGKHLLWWRHFSKELHLTSDDPLSQNLFAFDFGHTEGSLKAYFFQLLKSLETGKSEGRLIFDAVLKLHSEDFSIAPALALVEAYVASCPPESNIRVEALSFDCCNPSDSRIKVYIRSPYTSLKRMSEVYTLGGRLTDSTTREGLKSLTELWPLILNVGKSHSEDDELPIETHRTARLFYNFEIRPGLCYPEPKVYIPVKHYGKSDIAVAQGLSTFFRQQEWIEFPNSYTDNLRAMFPHHNLDAKTGTQGWVSFGFKKNKGPYMTVYYSPKVYSTDSGSCP